MDSWQRFNPSGPWQQGAPNMEDLLAWDRRGRNPYSLGGQQQQPGVGKNPGHAAIDGSPGGPPPAPPGFGGEYLLGRPEAPTTGAVPPLAPGSLGGYQPPMPSPLPQLSPYNGGTYQNPGARLYDAPSTDGQTPPQPWRGGLGSPPTPGLPAPTGPWVDPARVNDLLRGMNRGGNFGGGMAGGAGGMAGGASRPSTLGDPVAFNKWRGIA